MKERLLEKPKKGPPKRSEKAASEEREREAVRESGPNARRASTGEVTTISVPDGGDVPVAVSQKAYDRFAKLSGANDREGAEQMGAMGLLWLLSSGTRVRVISPGIMSSEVRVLDGPRAGHSCILAAEFVDRIKETSNRPTAEPSPSGSSQEASAGKTATGSGANSTAMNSADGMSPTVAYQTSITWESSKLGCCRVVVIAPSDTTEERLKVLGSQLRHELQGSRATWVWIYDEFKAVQLEADRSPSGFTPESALEPIYSHLVASYTHEDPAIPDEFFLSSRSEPTSGKYRWRQILYSSDGPGPVTVMPDAVVLPPDTRELKKALLRLPTPQGHSVNDDQRPQQTAGQIRSAARVSHLDRRQRGTQNRGAVQRNGLRQGQVAEAKW